MFKNFLGAENKLEIFIICVICYRREMGEVIVTLNAGKTSFVVAPMPPTRTTSFSVFMLTILDPYLENANFIGIE